MKTPTANVLSACKGYIEAHSIGAHGRAQTELPFITISREAGAGAVKIGQLVAELLNQRKKADEPPWTVFDRNLVEQVLQDHELPERIKQFMPENAIFELRDAVEELLGLHPSSWTLLEHTTDTILRLAHLGNVIIVGRGGNIITANMASALHARLVAPLEARIEHAAELYELEQKQAVEFVRKTDRARARYVRSHFNARIDDPLQYDITINTGRRRFEATAQLIVDATHSLLV